MKFTTDRDFIEYLKAENDYEELVATYFDNHRDLCTGVEGAKASVTEWEAFEKVGKGLKLIFKYHLPKEGTPEAIASWYRKVGPVLNELVACIHDSYIDYQLLMGHLADPGGVWGPDSIQTRTPGSLAYFIIQCLQKSLLKKFKTLPDYETFKAQYGTAYICEKTFKSLDGGLDGAYARATKFPGVYEEIFDSKKEDLKKLKRTSIMHTAAERAKIEEAAQKAAEREQKESAVAEAAPRVQPAAHSASADGTNRFWTDWGTGKKILYVILNLYTFCIPLILHFVLKFVKKALGKNK